MSHGVQLSSAISLSLCVGPRTTQVGDGGDSVAATQTPGSTPKVSLPACRKPKERRRLHPRPDWDFGNKPTSTAGAGRLALRIPPIKLRTQFATFPMLPWKRIPTTMPAIRAPAAATMVAPASRHRARQHFLHSSISRLSPTATLLWDSSILQSIPSATVPITTVSFLASPVETTTKGSRTTQSLAMT